MEFSPSLPPLLVTVILRSSTFASYVARCVLNEIRGPMFPSLIAYVLFACDAADPHERNREPCSGRRREGGSRPVRQSVLILWVSCLAATFLLLVFFSLTSPDPGLPHFPQLPATHVSGSFASSVMVARAAVLSEVADADGGRANVIKRYVRR